MEINGFSGNGPASQGSVVFDLDGTLADTSGDLVAAANACFRDMGHGDVLDLGVDKELAFRGGRAMLREGLIRRDALREETIETYYPRFLEVYGEAIDVHTLLYPRVIEAIERLKDSGYAVGICTNKPEGLSDLLLRRLGVRDMFGALVGADTLPVRKPDPEPLRECVRRLGGALSRACLIGDTDTDRRTAAAAGVPSVLVTFGPSGRAVADLAPEALLDDYADLPGLVSGLWSR